MWLRRLVSSNVVIVILVSLAGGALGFGYTEALGFADHFDPLIHQVVGTYIVGGAVLTLWIIESQRRQKKKKKRKRGRFGGPLPRFFGHWIVFLIWTIGMVLWAKVTWQNLGWLEALNDYLFYGHVWREALIMGVLAVVSTFLAILLRQPAKSSEFYMG